MISASESAEAKLKEAILHRFSAVGLGFRVTGDNKEPKGNVFSIKLDNEHTDDEVIDLHGVKVFLDPDTAARLKDCKLDYLEEPACFCLKRPSEGGDICDNRV
jgi:Fe-S cluster assembly iron-binding protein IscA